jgi:hypothetical protein
MNWRLLFLPADHAKEYELLRTDDNCTPRYGPHRQHLVTRSLLILIMCHVATTNGLVQEFLQTATEGGRLRNKRVKWQLIVLRGRRQRLSHDTICREQTAPAVGREEE